MTWDRNPLLSPGPAHRKPAHEGPGGLAPGSHGRTPRAGCGPAQSRTCRPLHVPTGLEYFGLGESGPLRRPESVPRLGAVHVFHSTNASGHARCHSGPTASAPPLSTTTAGTEADPSVHPSSSPTRSRRRRRTSDGTPRAKSPREPKEETSPRPEKALRHRSPPPPETTRSSTGPPRRRHPTQYRRPRPTACGSVR